MRPSLIAMLMWAAVAHAAEDPTADLDAERDLLIDKIVRGIDRPAQAKRFGELWRQRQSRIAGAEQADKERKAYRAAFAASADGWALDHCALAVDPAHPPATQENLRPTDWGRVAAVRMVKTTSDNPLAPAEIKVYDVPGEAKVHVVPARSTVPDWPALDAKVGDWLLVCSGSSEIAGLKIGGQPLIARKSRWNPVQMPPASFAWAISKQKWYYAPALFVLTHVFVEKDLGGGRLLIESPWDHGWILEAPASLRNRALLKPGRGAWVIAGHARLDAAAGKLVLTAEDIEERYLP